MHVQEFVCYDCNQMFFVTVTEGDSEESSTACPYCGSEDIEAMTVPSPSVSQAA